MLMHGEQFQENAVYCCKCTVHQGQTVMARCELTASFSLFRQSVTSWGGMATEARSITLRAPPSPRPPAQSVEVTRMIMKKLNKR